MVRMVGEYTLRRRDRLRAARGRLALPQGPK